MVRCRFRSHTAHVRSVRSTIRPQSIRPERGTALSDAASPKFVNTGGKVDSLLFHGSVGQVNCTNLQCQWIDSNIQFLSNSRLFDLKKIWGKNDGQDIRLTMESQEKSIDKGQVALKEIKPLHKVPLRFPNQINLHAKGKDVIPNKYSSRCNCDKDQRCPIVPPMQN